jgi:hypothetical protein
MPFKSLIYKTGGGGKSSGSRKKSVRKSPRRK